MSLVLFISNTRTTTKKNCNISHFHITYCFNNNNNNESSGVNVLFKRKKNTIICMNTKKIDCYNWLNYAN